MMIEKILYTDGHEVTVTESVFKVKKTMYRLNGITKHVFLIIQPHRLLPLLLALVGAVMISCGSLHLISRSFIPNLQLGSIALSANSIAIGLGIASLMVSLIVLTLLRERYAIRIATAEGEKNVLVSERKEYVAQVMDALNKAFMNLVSPIQEIKEINRTT